LDYFRAVEQFFNGVNRAINYFNRVLMRQIDRSSLCCMVAVSERLHVLLFPTRLQDATTVELASKQ